MILEIQRNGVQLHIFNIQETDVVLGRGNEADCPINAEDISRLHCRIKQKDGKYFVQDLKSSNGTFVYDERIAAGEFHEFLPDFPIMLGKNVKVFIHDSEPVQDLSEYGAAAPKKVSDSTKTQVFTGMLKKNALKTASTKGPLKSMGVILLVLLVLFGVIAYFVMEMKSLPEETKPIVTEVAPSIPEPVVDPNYEVMPKSGCTYDDEKAFCQGLELPQGDYVAVSNGEAALVVEWNRLQENKTADVATLPVEVREKYMLIQLVQKIRAIVSTMATPIELTSITLYGVSTDFKSVKKRMIVKLNGLPAELEQTEVLSKAIVSGDVQDFESKYGSLYVLESF